MSTNASSYRDACDETAVARLPRLTVAGLPHHVIQRGAADGIIFVDDEDRGALKVSFFGPFYSGYNVVEVDDDYNHMLVAGDNLDYLWILSRTPDIPGKVKDHFLAKAKKLGYKTSRLIWVEHYQYA